MDIISKRDGPRREDVRAKQLISENAGTIRNLADQITNGGYSRMRQDQARRAEQPKPRGLVIHDLKAPASIDEPDLYIKISLNNRVVLADAKSGRQVQLLGEIRGNRLARTFVLATSENGFMSPINDDTAAAIGHLANAALSSEFSEADLVKTLERCFGLGAG